MGRSAPWESSSASRLSAPKIKHGASQDDEKADEAGAAFCSDDGRNERGKCGEIGSGQNRPQKAGPAGQQTRNASLAPGNPGKPLELVQAGKAEVPLVSRIWRPGDPSHAAAFEQAGGNKLA